MRILRQMRNDHMNTEVSAQRDAYQELVSNFWFNFRDVIILIFLLLSSQAQHMLTWLQCGMPRYTSRRAITRMIREIITPGLRKQFSYAGNAKTNKMPLPTEFLDLIRFVFTFYMLFIGAPDSELLLRDFAQVWSSSPATQAETFRTGRESLDSHVITLQVAAQEGDIGNVIEVPQAGGQEGEIEQEGNVDNGGSANETHENAGAVGTGGRNLTEIAAEPDEADSDSSWHSLYEF